ncbi:hypothetical protein MalM25_13280 [Planctomycetes bacterium MalM25]|nr:hypothetical protein MalM25_13280 [Planctomycetes bacterium MalM25]
MSTTPAEGTIQALWVGPTKTTEFAPCHAALAERAELTHLDHPDSFDASRHTGYDLIIASCERPVVAPSQWQPLLKGDQSAELVQLLGVWCEGEGRTGKVLPRFERVFWHAWPGWLDNWLHRNANKESNAANLGPVELSGPVAIDSPDRELVAGLIATLTGEGVFSYGIRKAQTPRPVVVVWDGAQLRGSEADRLAAVCRRADAIDTPVVAMLDFPRPETVAAVRALGAAAVVGKPIDRDALLGVMRTALRKRAEAAPPPEITLPPFGLLAHEFGEGDLASPSRLVDWPDADAADGRAHGSERGAGEPRVPERLVGAVAPG